MLVANVKWRNLNWIYFTQNVQQQHPPRKFAIFAQIRQKYYVSLCKTYALVILVSQIEILIFGNLRNRFVLLMTQKDSHTQRDLEGTLQRAHISTFSKNPKKWTAIYATWHIPSYVWEPFSFREKLLYSTYDKITTLRHYCIFYFGIIYIYKKSPLKYSTILYSCCYCTGMPGQSREGGHNSRNWVEQEEEERRGGGKTAK